MKKSVKVLIILLIVILVGIGVWFTWKAITKKPEEVIESGDINHIEIGLAEKAIVVPVSIKEEARGLNRMVNAEYPSIQSFSNKNFQKEINDEITKVIFAYRDETKAIVDEQTPSTALYEYRSSYERYNHGDYLSLVISNDYETGGIRTNKWKDIYNIDVRNEKIIYLEDIFNASVNYEEEILSEIQKQATRNNYILMNGAGLNSLNHNQKFYIKDEKLIIYFDPAEIAPASYGELQFEMPFIFSEGKFII